MGHRRTHDSATTSTGVRGADEDRGGDGHHGDDERDDDVTATTIRHEDA